MSSIVILLHFISFLDNQFVIKLFSNFQTMSWPGCDLNQEDVKEAINICNTLTIQLEWDFFFFYIENVTETHALS